MANCKKNNIKNIIRILNRNNVNIIGNELILSVPQRTEILFSRDKHLRQTLKVRL